MSFPLLLLCVPGGKVGHHESFGAHTVGKMPRHLGGGVSVGFGESLHVHVRPFVKRQEEGVGGFVYEDVTVAGQFRDSGSV